jgi:hypothetical protein
VAQHTRSRLLRRRFLVSRVSCACLVEKAASAVPIVFADRQDPIKGSLVVSLARPAWKADTSCSAVPQVPGYVVRNKYTSANITWLSGIEPRVPGVSS